MPNIQPLFEKIQALPVERIAEIEDFVEFIAAREQERSLSRAAGAVSAPAFAAIQARHGRLDILVNNAGTNPYYGPVQDTDPGAFQKTVDVNMRGYFFMTTHAIKIMATQGGGAIVNVASVNAVVPGLNQGIYSITKAAVVGMTKSFARECAPLGIRVNALLPGLTATKLAGALLAPENRALWEANIPMGRPAQPNEMAGAVLYHVSPAASYTTGTALNVDGGFLLT